MDRDSPQSAGRKTEPPVEGDELPAIRSSSDIMWLYWKMYGNLAKGPNSFLSLSITNEAIQEIVSRATREVDPDAKSFPAWKGYEFDTDTPEGRAPLGTPNAQAFSYFLLQHKATLGNLYISKIRVFRDDRKEPGPNLLLVVEPVPANDDTKPATEPYQDTPSMFAKMKRHQGADAAGTVQVAAKSPATLSVPVPLIVTLNLVPDLFRKDPQSTYLDLYSSAADSQWDSAKCKGANFVNAMKGSDSEAGKIFNPPRDSAAGLYDENHLDDLTKWGWSGHEASEPGMKHYGVDGVLRDIGSSDTLIQNGGDVRLLSFKHGFPAMGDNGEWVTVEQQRYEVGGKKYRYTGAWYNFAVDETIGVIIASDRMSPQKIGSKASPTITGDDLPLIRAFSDVARISWAALADQTKTDVKNIHYFMSLSITNELTQHILSRCIREVLPGAWGFPDWPGIGFDTSTPQGQAILGTSNAKAFSYFLLQHKKELGNLHISKVRVFHDDNWIAHANLLLIVEPVPADAGEKLEELEEPHTSAAAEAQALDEENSISYRLRSWLNRAKL
ncbi:uncharacterized protein M421DRAFT_8805 [Didymella exigua CBS 183.55]|uniref:Uncharacterized protein n=1 Tax=Didymella exigua CBS 183.55 TaxID=1150837 RepID=A0A6A5RAC8_9PLEO|nr:uncharacterized protein M421DRAFT_8805 [Didymella exigua CBS 183.55]KAF1924503.1 hypothetical protein M421DRAFT_8805 [Didymella exigua CBS 183.55]